MLIQVGDVLIFGKGVFEKRITVFPGKENSFRFCDEYARTIYINYCNSELDIEELEFRLERSFVRIDKSTNIMQLLRQSLIDFSLVAKDKELFHKMMSNNWEDNVVGYLDIETMKLKQINNGKKFYETLNQL